MKRVIKGSIIGLLTAITLNAQECKLPEDCIVAKDLNVQFQDASLAYLDETEKNEIKDYAKFIIDADLFVAIEGHTSSWSKADFNYNLSVKRANLVRNELIAYGVDPLKIKAIGFGETSPLYDNETEEGRVKNRRVIAVVFNTAEELDTYIKSEDARITPLKFVEQ